MPTTTIGSLIIGDFVRVRIRALTTTATKGRLTTTTIFSAFLLPSTPHMTVLVFCYVCTSDIMESLVNVHSVIHSGCFPAVRDIDTCFPKSIKWSCFQLNRYWKDTYILNRLLYGLLNDSLPSTIVSIVFICPVTKSIAS